MNMRLRVLLLLAASGVFGLQAQKQRTSLERLDEARLEAVHEQRVQWMRDRKVDPPLGLYNDYRAVMHVHAEDADHTKGTRQEVLEAARDADVKIVMWSDHQGPKPDTWHGMRKGILFIPGSEDDDHKLRYPKEGDDLLFLSHIEEVPDKSWGGFQGMEIYNRHADSNAHKEMIDYLKKAMADPKEWSKLTAKLKKYPDEVFGAATGILPEYLARYDQEVATHHFTGIAANDAHRNVILNNVVFDPYEVSFRNVSTHILARDLKEEHVRASLREGHVYVAHDWLCDPAGFSFTAVNNLGLFEIGDEVPMINNTRFNVRLPIAAHTKLIRGGRVVYENKDAQFSYTPPEDGAYRLEAWLTVDGEERPWIYTNALYLSKAAATSLSVPRPEPSPEVKVEKDIVYTEGNPADEGKHKLDLYLPAGKENFPVLFFVHGGSWRSGDRSQYPVLGNRFAKQGIGVVVPSYRLAPQNAPPAQIEDVAAAFAWTVAHIAERGGDPQRIFVAGHSAGGHLVAELALDPRWLAKHQVKASFIKGVAALSGIYDVGMLPLFGPDYAARKQFSPIQFVNRDAPPFVITYCEHDYPGLARQAMTFDAVLRKAFVASHLIYVPKENHISEIVNIWKDDDPTALAVLGLIAGRP